MVRRARQDATKDRPTRVLLVRHGQASFGKRTYDALSDVGHTQARVLGEALAARGVEPTCIVSGGLRRHRETAEGIVAGLGQNPDVRIDEGWDEFDFDHVVRIHKPMIDNDSPVTAIRMNSGWNASSAPAPDSSEMSVIAMATPSAPETRSTV